MTKAEKRLAKYPVAHKLDLQGGVIIQNACSVVQRRRPPGIGIDFVIIGHQRAQYLLLRQPSLPRAVLVVCHARDRRELWRLVNTAAGIALARHAGTQSHASARWLVPRQ